MEAKAIFSQDAPKPLDFISQAVTVDGLVFCSGQIAMHPETGLLVQGSIGDRTERILLNLRAVLEAAGSSFDNIIKVNIYITNMQNFGKVNEVYASFFKGLKPARTCVGVAVLPLGTDIEIECTARKRRNINGSL